jgi:hypothetical protein
VLYLLCPAFVGGGNGNYTTQSMKHSKRALRAHSRKCTQTAQCNTQGLCTHIGICTADHTSVFVVQHSVNHITKSTTPSVGSADHTMDFHILHHQKSGPKVISFPAPSQNIRSYPSYLLSLKNVLLSSPLAFFPFLCFLLTFFFLPNGISRYPRRPAWRESYFPNYKPPL